MVGWSDQLACRIPMYTKKWKPWSFCCLVFKVSNCRLPLYSFHCLTQDPSDDIVSQQLSKKPNTVGVTLLISFNSPPFILRHLVEPMDCHPPEVLPMPRPFVSRVATRSMASPAKLATGKKRNETQRSQPSKFWGKQMFKMTMIGLHTLHT